MLLLLKLAMLRLPWIVRLVLVCSRRKIRSLIGLGSSIPVYILVLQFEASSCLIAHIFVLLLCCVDGMGTLTAGSWRGLRRHGSGTFFVTDLRSRIVLLLLYYH